MKFYRGSGLLPAVVILAGVAFAQDSICDRYTKAVFGDNTGSNQYSLMLRLINTAFIGNYTGPSTVKVTGILASGTFNSENVNLLPFFNGGFQSANRGYRPGNRTAINFLDDGGVVALSQNRAAFGQRSNQYKMFSHMYQFFGGLLQCSLYGKDGFPAFQGNARLYEVHKYMSLAPHQLGYFIQEIGLAGISLGLDQDDVSQIISTLNSTFGQACAPPTIVIPNQWKDLQAICINTACPVADNPVCDTYNHQGGFGVDPSPADITAGPQESDIAPVLYSIANGGRGRYIPMTTSLFDLTTTFGGRRTIIPTYTVVPIPEPPVSFTASDIPVTTVIDDTETVIISQTSVPVGGGYTVTVTNEFTTEGMIATQESLSIIPSSIIEMTAKTITADGSLVTSTFPVTIANPALKTEITDGVVTLTSVFTSAGNVFTTLIVTNSQANTTSTQSPNAAPLQTTEPFLVALVGAGLLGQLIL